MFGLPVFQKGQKKKTVKSMSTAEYHAAVRGESRKFRLMDTIDECMRYAGTHEEFITLMRAEGYEVRWEAERTAYLSPTVASAYSTPQSDVAVDSGNLAGALGPMVELGHTLERTQDDVPVKDAATSAPQTDHKILSKERRKKIAQGHAPDDHEDEQIWQQTM